jgi:hypothetical protein
MALRKHERSAATWIELNDAIRLAVCLASDDEKLVQLMSGRNWQFFDRPASVERVHGPDAVDLFPKAQEAHRIAVSFLKEVLASGCIRGEGVDVRSGQRRGISEAEWATRYINFRRNELSHPVGATASEYPSITAIAVNSADIENAYRHSSNTEALAKGTTTMAAESHAIHALAANLKSMELGAREQFAKAEARSFLAEKGFPSGPRPMSRIWPKAREEAGLPAQAPAGAKKKKATRRLETAD